MFGYFDHEWRHRSVEVVSGGVSWSFRGNVEKFYNDCSVSVLFILKRVFIVENFVMRKNFFVHVFFLLFSNNFVLKGCVDPIFLDAQRMFWIDVSGLNYASFIYISVLIQLFLITVVDLIGRQTAFVKYVLKRYANCSICFIIIW